VTTESEWEVYKYEVDMLRGTRQLCRTGLIKLLFSQTISNAVVESRVLHMRILVELLLSDGPDDNIKLEKLLPRFDQSKVDELRKAYEAKGEKRSPRQEINKMLAHPTNLRGDHHDYDWVFERLDEPIETLLAEVERERSKK